jgi:hypothetical protein
MTVSTVDRLPRARVEVVATCTATDRELAQRMQALVRNILWQRWRGSRLPSCRRRFAALTLRERYNDDLSLEIIRQPNAFNVRRSKSAGTRRYQRLLLKPPKH